MFLILGGIRVIFAVPLIHLKSGAPPTVDPRVLNFKGSNFKTLLTIFWGRAHVFLLIGVRLLIGTRVMSGTPAIDTRSQNSFIKQKQSKKKAKGKANKNAKKCSCAYLSLFFHFFSLYFRFFFAFLSLFFRFFSLFS